MNYFLQLSTFFFLGLIVESLLLLKNEIRKIDVLIVGCCISFSLLVGFFSLQGDYSQFHLARGLITAAVIFAVAFAGIFKSKILITINESTLLIWNLLFLYLYVQKFNSLSIVTVTIIFLSVATLTNALLKTKTNAFWKAIFYGWFLVMLTYFLISQFNFKNLAFLETYENIQEISLLTALFSGMALFYVIINIWYLYKLIPIPSENQNWKSRINEWKRDINLMISKYSDEQFSYTKNLASLIFIIIILLFNYRFQFATDGFLISFCISIIPLIALYPIRKTRL